EIFRSRKINGKYEDAEYLTALNGPNINSLEALIAPDESYILIGSFGRPGGAGNSDLFISYNADGSWTKPVGLGALIGTPAREESHGISPDGKWLYFSSERLTPSDRTKTKFTRSSLSACLTASTTASATFTAFQWSTYSQPPDSGNKAARRLSDSRYF